VVLGGDDDSGRRLLILEKSLSPRAFRGVDL
jgi:hypothetical protein